jgi:riboflavin synthase
VIAASAVLEGLAVGDSVAVNGACLTAVEVTGEGFAVDCVAETLRRTSLGRLAPGDPVNLERPMRLGDRLDGHLVQGHVDGVGTVRAVTREGEGAVLEIVPPPGLLRYVVEKGSIAVDGVSLTVASRLPDAFTVALIPHTMAVTTLGPGALDRPVNLEVDVVAKYVESLAAPYAPPREEGA